MNVGESFELQPGRFLGKIDWFKNRQGFHRFELLDQQYSCCKFLLGTPSLEE